MINEIDSYESLDKVRFILEDRFGKFSENMNIYMHEELFESQAKNLGIESIRQTKNFIELTLSKDLTSKIDGQNLFVKVSKLSRMFRFKMKLDKLIITLDIVKLDKHYIYYLMDFIKILNESIKK